LSFPHVLGGNLLFIKPNGCPTEAFGHDNFGILLPAEIIMSPKLVFPDKH